VIEILVVICIIGILASVILVSIGSSREKAANNAALTSLKSTASAAYMCLTDGGTPQLTSPAGASTSMCSVGAYSDWPDISRDGWSYNNPDFIWCNPSYNNNSFPAPCGAYNNGSCGGSSETGQFCYGLIKDTKHIWCTNTGCKKEGF